MSESTSETEADPPTTADVPPESEVENPLAIDYGAVHPPEGKSYTEFTYAERRATLLRRIERAGHPAALPQAYSEMGEEFGVSKSTIHNDLQVLAEWTAENVERDHLHIMDSVFRGAIQDLVEDGKRAWAAEVGKEWFEWLADMGAIERMPDEVRLDATVRHESDETDEYVVVPNDPEGPSGPAVPSGGAASGRGDDPGESDDGGDA
jgi:hypothetical protein